MPRAHFGASLLQTSSDWDVLIAHARKLETQGYDSLWGSDHMSTPSQYSGGEGGPAYVHGQQPLLEVWSMLAGVAALTERIELGTNCSNIMFRNPAVAARQIATVDRISGGRVVPGFGAGYATDEFIKFGAPPWRQWQRVRALSEALDIVRPLLAGELVTLEGTYFQAREAMCAPTPLRCPPPLLVGGASDTTLRATARHATIWNNPPLYEGQLVQNLERLRGFCAEEQRDPDEITVSMRARISIARTQAEAERGIRGMAEAINDVAAKAVEEHGIWGTPDRVCEKLDHYLGLGCTHFVIDFYGGDRTESEALFAEAVIPAFR